MEKRKGQVSIFLVLILVLILIIFLVQQTKEQQKKEVIDHGHLQLAFEDLPFQKFTSVCLEKTIKGGLEYLGGQGGMFDSFERQFLYQGAHSVVLYLNSSREQLPLKEELESELEKYVTGNMPHCVRNHLLYQNMSVTGNAFVTLSPTELTSHFAGTARSEKGEEKKIEALKRLPTKYLHLFETAQRIVALQKEAGTEMPLGALSLLVEGEGVHFTIISLGGSQFIIALTPEEREDERVQDGGGNGERAGTETRKKEVFLFGVQYDWQ